MSLAAPAPTRRKEIATLAGGCFWCLEAVFDELKGVESVESGYMGGQTRNPTYQQVCNGDTGHAEVVRVTFDPSVLSFDELLEVFFVIHDPTTLNYQGNDFGTQYRSAIFYHTPEQKAVYMEMRQKMDEVRKECMAKMQAVRQEFEPKFKAVGLTMPGDGRGPGGPGGPKPGMR